MDEPITPGYYWAQWASEPDGQPIIVEVSDFYAPPLEVYTIGDDTNHTLDSFIFLERIPPHKPTVIIKYWSLHSWPYSIDQSPMTDDKELRTIEVSPDEIYTKNGKRYYRMVCGHGEYVDLLVE